MKSILVATLLALFTIAACAEKAQRSSIGNLLDQAIHLQKLGMQPGVSALQKELQEKTLSDWEAICLCRMLFEPAKGKIFRCPMIGGFIYPGGTGAKDWPLEPITIYKGIPINITMGMGGAGSFESAEHYIKYCAKNCVWRVARYQLKTNAEINKLLKEFVDTTKWHEALEEYDLKSILKQGQPLKDKQQ